MVSHGVLHPNHASHLLKTPIIGLQIDVVAEYQKPRLEIAHMFEQSNVLKTVGELRARIANLPDNMPLHHRGDMGDFPPGKILTFRKLAEHKMEPYFADIENDPVWSNRKYRDEFGEPVACLCL